MAVMNTNAWLFHTISSTGLPGETGAQGEKGERGEPGPPSNDVIIEGKETLTHFSRVKIA